jgi:hypothetical protein
MLITIASAVETHQNRNATWLQSYGTSSHSYYGLDKWMNFFIGFHFKQSTPHKVGQKVMLPRPAVPLGKRKK